MGTPPAEIATSDWLSWPAVKRTELCTPSSPPWQRNWLERRLWSVLGNTFPLSLSKQPTAEALAAGRQQQPNAPLRLAVGDAFAGTVVSDRFSGEPPAHPATPAPAGPPQA